MKTQIIGRRILLGSLSLSAEPVTLDHYALMPSHRHDGHAVWVHYWTEQEGMASIHYSIAPGPHAEICTMELPIETIETPIPAPRGRGWQWDFGKWVRRTSKGIEEVAA
jgi:hypothetical protein